MPLCYGRLALRQISLIPGLVMLGGCGAGTAAIGAAANGGGGGGNSPPTISNLQVPVFKTSPAGIRFELFDQEGETVEVELCARLPLPGGGLSDPHRLEQVSGPLFPQNGASIPIPAGAAALSIEADWFFSDEDFLPNDGRLVEDIQLVARLSTGLEAVLGDDEPLALGNDAPAVHDVQPIPTDPENPGESSGNVELRLRVSDSSSDVVDIAVEWRRTTDPPDAWTPAAAAGVFPEGIETEPEPGVEVSFFWNTNIDLGDEEEELFLRVSADDRIEQGEFATTVPFRVDNNSFPTAFLDDGLFLLNPDDRGAIPIPILVRDEESDPVEIVLQWSYEGEDFPLPPQTIDELEDILADSGLRRANQICTELPAIYYGRATVLPEDCDPSLQISLPELASSAASLHVREMDGRTLDILRSSSTPRSVAGTWNENHLRCPVAALPIGDGITALVLDRPFRDSWHLIEIDLATGKRVRQVTDSSVGEPTAMVWERGGSTVLVAVDLGGMWRVYRVDVGTPSETTLVITAADGDVEQDSVRAIASLGTNAALITAGASLIGLRFPDPSQVAPRAVPVLTGLATPWGIAVDPRGAQRIYLAEKGLNEDPGRLLSVDLNSRITTEIVDGTVFPRPEAIALERSGMTLLAITDNNNGKRSLRGLNLGRGEDAFVFDGELPGGNGIAAGPAGLRLIPISNPPDIAVGGGILQRRTLVTTALDPGAPKPYDPRNLVATVDTPFEPLPVPNAPWRIVDAFAKPGNSCPEGTTSYFVWDSKDVAPGGRVKFRAVPRDTDLGPSDTILAPKVIRPRFEAFQSLQVVDIGDLPALLTADFDGDGLLDLASAALHFFTNLLTIYFQSSPGSFCHQEPCSLPCCLELGPVGFPNSLVAADFNGDRLLDLASANGDDTLTVFFQGEAAGEPVVLGGPTTISRPMSLVAADFNGDGRADLASANAGISSDSLTVFFQPSAGGFVSGAQPDRVLEFDEVTPDRPQSLVSAELNGDGLIDLASANQGGNRITVFFQVSAGEFSSEPVVLGDALTTFGPVALVAADFDGDGHTDLASANANDSSGTLTVFYQPAGGFVSRPQPDLVLGGPTGPTIDPPVSLVAADLNGDELVDLAAANPSSNTLAVFLQRARGDFFNVPLELVNDRPEALVAADLNGDGAVDLATANSGTGTLATYFQLAPGVFLEPRTLGEEAALVFDRSLAVGDLNADGLLDLALPRVFGSEILVFLQQSPGVFASESFEIETTPGTVSLVTGDLNGDGLVDLASASPLNDTLAVFFQPQVGGFTTQTQPDHVLEFDDDRETLHRPGSLAVGDLDGDGRLDLASANSGTLGDRVTVFFQRSSGGFASEPHTLRLADDTKIIHELPLVIGDLDDDGLSDLASANLTDDTLVVFFQLPVAPVDFRPLVLHLDDDLGTIHEPRSLAVGDLNGDGLVDLASANSSSDTISVFFQLVGGSFEDPCMLGGGDGPGATDGPESLVVADITRDGLLDIVSVNQIGDSVTVFVQLSPGEFAQEPLVLGFGEGARPVSLVAADLNGDGVVDLTSTTANISSSKLVVFLSDG